ncbi:GNAT family N-acetyltransferase [Microvirga tunisiensis]|uniref:GNAT family N-acetyltransferase n=2 Tax=Pannonibacter tanglangensis TaxID=2750084 RepID=A0A7X5J8C7_9HYPH|nr:MULTISPECIES: N-acetyltransferase [unclassified Pannonibacter]NBN62983.1 GNAT family N-acetyltransferase [Pannonibacter sp. XCT-34]NBN78554.1 GNAT family N-acetyltransferase [Pannonibacter sp. XCT-53]
MIEIVDEAPAHVGARELLLDRAFGPDRYRKTSERLREGRLPAFAFSALEEDGTLVGTLRLWNVDMAGAQSVLLLGPLAVEASCRSGGIGARLMRQALNRAAVAGHSAILLVGDAPYYERFGFSASLTLGLELPGPVERARFLGLELQPHALAAASGMVVPAGCVDPVFDQVFPVSGSLGLAKRAA